MSMNHRSFSEQLHCPRIPVKEIGLKEWAVVIDAIKKGEQLILVRKGGLIEETKEFRLEDTSFYLYPTFEHNTSSPLQEASICCLAHVTDDIELSDGHALEKISSFHIFTDEYAKQHLYWKKTKPLHILIVRAYGLSKPVTIPVLEQYSGCRSWIKLETAIEKVDFIPILDDRDFHNKRMEILRRLGLAVD